MKNKTSVINKIAAILVIAFSSLKLVNFISLLFTIYHFKSLELNGKYISLSAKDTFLNKWFFATELIGFILYVLLLNFGLGIFMKKNVQKNIIRISLIIIFIYYPWVIVSDYFILGKNSLAGLIPASFSSLFLLFFIFYFSVFYKGEN